ncbi:S41 family peptidase [Streptomyces sp. NPDC059578]|uniref:S41 family peptidase n=1 Tax=Streptomyces sp. NPDC059578 TaxID=3346874 RepID=UPI0036A00DE7
MTPVTTPADGGQDDGRRAARPGRRSVLMAAGTALALSGTFGATAVAAPRQRGAGGTGHPTDGLWRMDGYGMVLRIQDGVLRSWDTTAISCRPALNAPQQGAAGPDGAVRFEADDMAFSVRPQAKDRATLLVHGTAGDRDLRRISALPPHCGRPGATGPVADFDVFWQTFAEQYAFFQSRGVDWNRARATYRPRVTARTGPAELFDILAEMTAPLQDSHVALAANSPDFQRFADGIRSGTVAPDEAYEQKTRLFIERRDLAGRPLESHAQGVIGYADLPGGLGYLRISRFAGYVDNRGRYDDDAAELERVLDRIVTRARTAGPGRWRGLIIDVRVNAGGYDPLGLAIASRLTDRSYTAFTKQARNDPRDETRFTRRRTVRVQPAAPGTPRYDGPVALLISGATVSAGETFTHAVQERPGLTTLIGENTQGVFSDTLGRELPNGWQFTLSNERYTDPRGRSFEGPGIPADIRTPVFTDQEFAADRDTAFDRARQILGRP